MKRTPEEIAKDLRNKVNALNETLKEAYNGSMDCDVSIEDRYCAEFIQIEISNIRLKL